MAKKKAKGPRPKASDRIFYTAPRKWKVWDLFLTPPAMVIYVLTIGFTIALINLF